MTKNVEAIAARQAAREELTNEGYKFHHSAMKRGYLSTFSRGEP